MFLLPRKAVVFSIKKLLYSSRTSVTASRYPVTLSSGQSKMVTASETADEKRIGLKNVSYILAKFMKEN